MLYTIPAEKSFVDVLGAYVLRSYGDAPESLASVLILLPSRRACIALREAFLRHANGRALLLPRMQAIGDLEDELGEILVNEAGEAIADLPPAIAPLKRHMLLTELVAASHDLRGDKAQAAMLAADLARLLDDMAREEQDFSGLAALVPKELASHWQQTVRLLEIIAVHWPKLLEAEGACDPIVRRGAVLSALAIHWAHSPPAYPVIAAGSTGSQAATRRLLGTVACLPTGMLIFPGLDKNLNTAAWDALGETHPQAGMKRLLVFLDVPRSDVKQLDIDTVPTSCPLSRIEMLRSALLPAEVIASDWNSHIVFEPNDMMQAECASQEEEACVIALTLREALETPGKHAALVTADRMLARRVVAELRRFSITIDDSAGRPLLSTPPAVFLLLLAEAVLAGLAPIPLLALLKHPLCTAGLTPAECRRAARLLETTQLRGIRRKAGLATMLERAARCEGDPVVHALLTNINQALGEFMQLCGHHSVRFAAMLEAHLHAAQRMAQESGLFAGESREALGEMLAELRLHAQVLGTIDPQHYPELLHALLGSATSRQMRGEHPRLHILSPIEARLQHFDVVILGGLNEGSWPAQPEASPWMSHAMGEAFGLAPPERAVGQAAHDFWMLAGAPRVLLTRARKVAGAQTQPSRWWLRLKTLLAASGEQMPETPALAWARMLDTAAPQETLGPPAPTPPVSARPRALPVTKIERWQRDPYAIYAEYILRLKPLDAHDREPDAREFGTLMHAALERFTKAYPHQLPEHAREKLLECGREAFARYDDRPAVRACWWPRFEAAAEWIIEQERASRTEGGEILAEQNAQRSFIGPAGPFVLSARADRVERHANGLTLVDYKTGKAPKEKERKAGIALQLPLTAALIAENKPVRTLAYWELAGEASQEKIIAETPEETQAQIHASVARLKALIAAYDDPVMPYHAVPDPALAPERSYNAYAHLERQEEWEDF